MLTTRTYDTDRDGWLRNQGFVILRFWNNDVLKNIDGVTEVIAKNLQNTPFLIPSRGKEVENEEKCLVAL